MLGSRDHDHGCKLCVASVELQAMLSSGATSDIEVVSRRRSRHNSSLHRYLAVDAALVPKHGRQRTQAARHKNNIINHTNTETVQNCPNLSESQLFQAAEFPPAVFNG